MHRLIIKLPFIYTHHRFQIRFIIGPFYIVVIEVEDEIVTVLSNIIEHGIVLVLYAYRILI